MKKIIIAALITVAIATVYYANHLQLAANKPIACGNPVAKKAVTVSKKAPVADTLKTIPVGKATFDQIASYIETHGFSIGKSSGTVDHQITFFDKAGTRHAFMTIHYGKEIVQISVWAYRNGIKDQSHYFGYAITNERVAAFDADDNNKLYPEMKQGYDGFLKKIAMR